MFGLRRPRLSDEETERRMLQTAAEALGRSGLTVSLEHIRLEDVIREAGVSRSAVYRRWPHKDQFLGDLLLEVAKANAPMASTGGPEVTELVRRIVLEHLDWLASPMAGSGWSSSSCARPPGRTSTTSTSRASGAPTSC